MVVIDASDAGIMRLVRLSNVARCLCHSLILVAAADARNGLVVMKLCLDFDRLVVGVCVVWCVAGVVCLT